MELVTVKSLPKLIGKGYKSFWEFKGRYRVLKGGRGSKKSTTAAFWYVYFMMFFWEKFRLKPCVIVVRRYFYTHRQSTFAQIQWAINRLGVAHLWKSTVSPMEFVYKPSGQKIIFRGLDQPENVTSMTVDDGYLCWGWLEEAYQITSEDAFNKIDMSIRGDLPEPLFKQITLTFNPWSDKTWIKPRFFDVKNDPKILTLTRNYDCNEFLGKDDYELFEEMKIKSPRRYAIEGQGNWGISEGLVFENWREQEFDFATMRALTDNHGKQIYRELNGIDFGYTNDPFAFIATLVDEKKMIIYIYDEIYRRGLSNKAIANSLKYHGFLKAQITADSADPKSIAELKSTHGVSRIVGAEKGKGSVLAGIQTLQDFQIIVHPRCVNTLIEFANYVWAKDRSTDKLTNNPVDEYNHLMDALRYATEKLHTYKFSW